MTTQAAKIIQATPARRTVLVVDDEASIRRTLKGIFDDEGFEVLLASDAETALEILQKQKPSVVLLDIWMPGIDGIEALRRIRQACPDLPVIMISGHATIATAVTATRLGACDFIEKPLDLNATLRAVRKALGEHKEVEILGGESASPKEGSTKLNLSTVKPSSSIEPIVFSSQTLRGRKIPQKTLAQSALLYGQGLHSGTKSGLMLEPLPPNSGIHFVGVPETSIIPAHVDFVASTGFATSIKSGQTQVSTIEHLMSALHAYGISNLRVKCNGEVPVLDGSSREFCTLFDDVGLEEQDGSWYEIEVKKLLRIERGHEFIQIEPADEFIIDYTLDYPEPVGRQQMSFVFGDPESYKREIAPARTFGFMKDIGALQKQGLALGGRLDNFVLFGEGGALNGELRFSDEPVRHKILDAIGDLYLLGRRLRGKVTACMTGHSDNIALLKLLREELKR